MATAGPVNRTLLQSFYQNAGDVYDDTKTEGAFGTLADQLDANYDYTAGLVAGGVLQPYPAFLSRQALINGNFDVWQRGTSWTNPTGTVYTTDRWYNANAVDNNVKVLQSTTTPNKKSKYSVRIEGLTGVGGAGAYSTFAQKVEDYQFFAGQQVTLSGWIKCDAGANVDPYISDGVGVYVAPRLSSTSWTYFSYTTTINANPTQLQVSFQVNRGGLAVGSGVNIAQAQVNVGSIALPFQPRSFAEELKLCQRYYEKSYDYAVVPGTAASTNGRVGFDSSGGVFTGSPVSFKSRKRTVPTVSVYSPNTGTINKLYNASTGADLNAGPDAPGENGFKLIVSNVASSTGNILQAQWIADAEL